jgi:ketosteroid isomerase-like protein
MPDGGEDHGDIIRATIRKYQSTFGDGDREGWLSLFTDDGVLEDPVGTRRCEGRRELGAFWDEIHAAGHEAHVVPVTAPAVCGLEAAWAFEVHVDAGDRNHVITIVDVARFADDGRIAHNRAFWDPSTVRVLPKT